MILDISDKEFVEVFLEIKPKNRWQFLKYVFFNKEFLYTMKWNKKQAKSVLKLLNDWNNEIPSKKIDNSKKNVYKD